MNGSLKNHKKLKKGCAISALLLASALSLCSCGFSTGSFLEALESIQRDPIIFEEIQPDVTDGDADGGMDTIEVESREEITIEKSDSIGEDNVTSAGQAYNSISQVYYAVADSVVEITTETVQTSLWMGQYVSTGAGSGVIIDESGLIVTNNHVIEGASTVIVRLTDGSEYKAKLVGTEASADLAVLKINAGDRDLTVARLGCSADLVVGEDVVAIGNPLGSLGGTLTTGIISATERYISIDGEDMVLLQTNAAINPGNSGGGLFNMAGQLVGVVNAKAAGSDVEGLGFAIPVDYAHIIIEDLVNYGYVRGKVDHGLIMLDVTAQNLPSAYRKYGITNIGVVILDSAYSDALKYGDTIVSVNGQEVSSSSDVELIIKKLHVGDVVTFCVTRGKEQVEVKLELHEKVPDTVSFG